MDKMRAAVLVEPSKIVCEETPLFEPEAGQVVVKTIWRQSVDRTFIKCSMEPTVPNSLQNQAGQDMRVSAKSSNRAATI